MVTADTAHDTRRFSHRHMSAPWSACQPPCPEVEKPTQPRASKWSTPIPRQPCSEPDQHGSGDALEGPTNPRPVQQGTQPTEKVRIRGEPDEPDHHVDSREQQRARKH